MKIYKTDRTTNIAIPFDESGDAYRYVNDLICTFSVENHSRTTAGDRSIRMGSSSLKEILSVSEGYVEN